MTVKEGLQKALTLLDDGRNWGKGGQAANCEKECAATAIGRAFDFDVDLIKKGIDLVYASSSPISLIRYNDRPETTFADIKSLFEKAIAAAE